MASQEIWFVTGSQTLYGSEILKQVEVNSAHIVGSLNESGTMPVSVRFASVMKDPEAIRELVRRANSDESCIGLILWMHTFSPAKMWIGGLTQLVKPVCHLHTQFNRELPWDSIDMDFMNLNQSAHGDREAGHLHTRIGLRRKVVAGHWSSARVQKRLGDWARVVLAWADWQGAKFAKIGDNMRFVSVTDGDRVSAEAQFGFSVNGFGIGDVVAAVNGVDDSAVNQLVSEYEELYDVMPELRKGGDRHESLKYGARQEIGLREFLKSGGFKGFTTTFEDLHGLDQLPGFACQRLMADGFGFGAEGDWKTSALLRAFKQMDTGLENGTSFMEDYTYDLTPGSESVLGSHMLEICPTIAASKPRLEIHPLGIGGKADPVRLVFDCRPGAATNTTLVDLGHRFRFIVNEVDSIEVPAMPKLPVARALWTIKPDFETGVEAWIYGGGAHHTVFSYNIKSEQVQDFAEIAGVECVVIGEGTRLSDFRNELRWNQGAFANRG